MDDLISRQFAIKELESGKDKKAKGEIGGFYNQIIENDIEKLKKLPSTQPEIKPIDYRDCANAMLKMWMLDVVTDGEYNKIMDKLNNFERKRLEKENE